MFAAAMHLHRFSAVMFGLLLFTSACENKNRPKDTGGSPKPAGEMTADPVGKAPDLPKQPSPDPTPAADVRPPVAADLPEYTKDLPGSGTKLMAKIETSMGTLNCELYGDKAPMTVANFIGLATGQKPYIDGEGKEQKGKPFFDGLTFHRVIPEFMIQGGDPKGTGTGGPGYDFNDEINPELKMQPGTLAMANAGKKPDGGGTNGSQFFITEIAPDWLNGKHTIFGQCKEVDLVKKIARVPKEPGDKPTTPVTIKHVTITKS